MQIDIYGPLYVYIYFCNINLILLSSSLFYTFLKRNSLSLVYLIENSLLSSLLVPILTTYYH